jgi:uncharacterized protein with ParB-like and HNH nuclease domain
LTIPIYQRPYKWTSQNVSQLFEDIDLHKTKQAYRLGTLVFHRDEDEQDCLNIVDGQQRTLTLMLAVLAIIETRLIASDKSNYRTIEDGKIEEALTELQNSLEAFISSATFDSEISQHNLHQNYLVIKRHVSRSEFTEAHIDFLLNKCEVVTFTLNNVSEAFQFFDSQNARGRDLEPHDLLKAFHLREFSENENHLKANTVSYWEDLETKSLADLFSQYLYRIRQWTRGNSARYFSKDDISLFKGVNLDKVEKFPYVSALRIAHYFVDDYNDQYQRNVDGNEMTFPFHLDQILINGRRFFEMAKHYDTQIKHIVSEEHADKNTLGGQKLTEQAQRILKTLDSYNNKKRTGDKYVRSIFDCLIVYYIDKFDYVEISRAIEKIFVWAYSLRISMQVVQLASMDNHVLNNNWFISLKEAVQPSNFLNLPLLALSDSQNKNNISSDPAKDELVILFKEMNYYE